MNRKYNLIVVLVVVVVLAASQLACDLGNWSGCSGKMVEGVCQGYAVTPDLSGLDKVLEPVATAVQSLNSKVEVGAGALVATVIPPATELRSGVNQATGAAAAGAAAVQTNGNVDVAKLMQECMSKGKSWTNGTCK